MTPLVFVHGFLGGSRQWRAQLAAFQGEFDVITIDLPGFGKNAHLDVMNRISDFAEWVLDELSSRGIHRFHLVGHSMGGMIAQEIVGRDPGRVDRLVLYGTGASGVLPGRFEPITTSRRRACDDGPQSTARRIAATWFFQNEAAEAFEACATIAESSSLDAILAGLEAMEEWSGVTQLSNIRARTLVLWGDYDRTYCWAQTEQLWNAIQEANLAVLPGCAHAVHLEKPDLFNSILGDFLRA